MQPNQPRHLTPAAYEREAERLRHMANRAARCRELAPIGLIGEVPNVLQVNPELPVRSVRPSRRPELALAVTPKACGTIAFDAAGSRDPEGSALSYRWGFDGETPAAGEAAVAPVHADPVVEALEPEPAAAPAAEEAPLPPPPDGRPLHMVSLGGARDEKGIIEIFEAL